MTNVRPSAGISDHCIILADMSNKVRLPSKPPRNVPLWRKADNEDLKRKTAGMKDNLFTEKPEEKHRRLFKLVMPMHYEYSVFCQTDLKVAIVITI